MLHRCCTATLLLLVVGCAQCLSVTLNDCVHSECEFHSDYDGATFTTRVTFNILDNRVFGFTSNTVNTKGTIVSRVNATFKWPKFDDNVFIRNPIQPPSERGSPMIIKSPFVKEFWYSFNQLYLIRLSVHVYNNMSVKPVVVSKMRDDNLEELELMGNSWVTTSGLNLYLRRVKKLYLSNNQIEELHEETLNYIQARSEKAMHASNSSTANTGEVSLDALALEFRSFRAYVAEEHKEVNKVTLLTRQSSTAGETTMGQKDLVNGFPYLEVLDLSRNKIININYIYRYITKNIRETIKEVNLAENIISEFHYSFFDYGEQLKKLNLSYNRIHSIDLFRIPKISEVDVSFNNIPLLHGLCYSFSVDQMILAGQNISSLSEVGTILSSYDYIDYNLREYSISYVKRVYHFPVRYGNVSCISTLYVPQSQCNINKKYIYCKGNDSRILPRQGSTLVFLAGNPIKIVGYLQLEMQAENLLDLSQNLLKDLNGDIPSQMSDTKQLNLSRNNIGYISRHFFKNMMQLTVLDLSHNQLKHMQLILYSPLSILDISKNYLTRMNISHYSSNYTTKYLNLSRNNFRNILEVEWSQFKQFSKVDLGQNNLQCCGPEWHYSRRMLLRYQEKVLNINSTKALLCMMPYNMRVEMTDTWLSDDHCENSLQGWVAFGCLLFLTPLMMHAVELLNYYIHQTERDLADHLTCLKKQDLEQDESHALECEYDAFICHSNKDIRWVHRELVPNLENDRHGHRLCIHYRDFPLGSLIEENIETAMKKSRKVIVVVTRAFLDSYWCKMELTFAWIKMVSERRNYIIVIELEKIPKEKRPPILCYLMERRTYLEWPEEATDDDKQNCWSRMRDALGKSLRDRHRKQLKRVQHRKRRQNGTVALQIDC